ICPLPSCLRTVHWIRTRIHSYLLGSVEYSRNQSLDTKVSLVRKILRQSFQKQLTVSSPKILQAFGSYCTVFNVELENVFVAFDGGGLNVQFASHLQPLVKPGEINVSYELRYG